MPKRDGVKFKDEGEQKSSQLVDGKMTWKVMQQVKQQQKEEGFDTAKDYEDNFPSLGGDLGGTEEFDENDEQYEDVEGDECEEIIIDEDDDKTIQAFTGGGVRNVFHLVNAAILKPGLGRFTDDFQNCINVHRVHCLWTNIYETL